MKKTTETKEREFVTLKVEKIQFEPGQDWGCIDLKVDPGLYLGEFEDGCLCFFVVDRYGNRSGVAMDSKTMSDLHEEIGTQKVVLEFDEYMKEYEMRFGKMADKMISLATDNNIILNALEDAAKENAQTIAQSLVNMEKQIKELPKQTENQKSSLTEMGEVVVNIIKATK